MKKVCTTGMGCFRRRFFVEQEVLPSFNRKKSKLVPAHLPATVCGKASRAAGKFPGFRGFRGLNYKGGSLGPFPNPGRRGRIPKGEEVISGLLR